jgi:hypothetical protein
MPRSWWVTTELRYQAATNYLLECVLYQNGGCKGNEPELPKFPEDIKVKVRSKEELADKRRRAREHLAKRRREEAEVSRGI